MRYFNLRVVRGMSVRHFGIRAGFRVPGEFVDGGFEGTQREGVAEAREGMHGSVESVMVGGLLDKSQQRRQLGAILLQSCRMQGMDVFHGVRVGESVAASWAQGSAVLCQWDSSFKAPLLPSSLQGEGQRSRLVRWK